MANSKVSIIVLNWNGEDDTIECLESLYQIDYDNYEVLLVDNGSKKESVEKIKRWAKGEIKVESPYFKYNPKNKPISVCEYTKKELEDGSYFKKKKKFDKLKSNEKLFIIENDKNYGFAEGNNIAIRQVLKENKSEFVLLLNNDTVVDKMFLRELVKFKEKNGTIRSGVIYKYYNKKEVDFAGGKINWWLGRPYHLKKQPLQQAETEFITGCLMMIPIKILEELGGFDNKYFCYFEDSDFCERAKNNGITLWINPKSIIWHKINHTSIRNSTFFMEQFARNRIIFNKRFNKKSYHFISFIFFQVIIKGIIAFFLFNKDQRKSWFTGIKKGLKAK